MNVRPAAPAYVQFYPTLRCNLACDFCFNRGLPPLPDVEPADFARMLDRLRAAGVDTLDLLGGEPTLHPRLDELVGRDRRAPDAHHAEHERPAATSRCSSASRTGSGAPRCGSVFR